MLCAEQIKVQLLSSWICFCSLPLHNMLCMWCYTFSSSTCEWVIRLKSALLSSHIHSLPSLRCKKKILGFKVGAKNANVWNKDWNSTCSRRKSHREPVLHKGERCAQIKQNSLDARVDFTALVAWKVVLLDSKITIFKFQLPFLDTSPLCPMKKRKFPHAVFFQVSPQEILLN